MSIKELHSWFTGRKVSFTKSIKNDCDESKGILNDPESTDESSSNGTVGDVNDQDDEDSMRKMGSDQSSAFNVESNLSQTDSTILTMSSSLSSIAARLSNDASLAETKLDIEPDGLENEARVSLLSTEVSQRKSNEASRGQTDAHLPGEWQVSFASKALYILDFLVSLVVFSPLVGIYWFSTWTFLDKYFMSENLVLSNFTSYFIGLLVLLPSYVLQRDMQDGYDYFKRFGKFGKLIRFLLRNIYMVVINLAIVMEWRGLWNLIDHYFHKDLTSQLALAIIAILFFSLTRSTGSLISTPFIMYRDDHVHPFACESRFKFESISYFKQYTFDFFWAEIIECFALILAWRGIGELYEHWFDDQQLASLVATFSISHLSYFVIIFIKIALLGDNKYIHLGKRARNIVKDLLNVFMFASSCLVWKFYWDLTELFLSVNYLQKNEFYFYIVCFVLSNLIAIIFNVTVLLAGPAASINESPAPTQAASSRSLFEISYLSTIFKK